jgi:hypothetical protein
MRDVATAERRHRSGFFDCGIGLFARGSDVLPSAQTVNTRPPAVTARPGIEPRAGVEDLHIAWSTGASRPSITSPLRTLPG